MPIDRKKYPIDWPKISLAKREKTGFKCELCPAENGKAHWKTGSHVVITVHHIDGNKFNNSKHNLIALCQRCHLRLDRERHIRNRQARRHGHQLNLEV